MALKQFKPKAYNSKLSKPHGNDTVARLADLNVLVDYINANANYKIYTALLTQYGGDNPTGQTSGTVTKGITYFVYATTEGVSDFSNVGGKFQTPGLGDYYFVATITGTPNNYGGGAVDWNTGAPTTKVLNNTIEDIWFTFNGDGVYTVKSSGLFTLDKTFIMIGSAAEAASNGAYITAIPAGDSSIIISSVIVTTLTAVNDELFNTSFEIRIYN